MEAKEEEIGSLNDWFTVKVDLSSENHKLKAQALLSIDSGQYLLYVHLIFVKRRKIPTVR